MLFPRALPRILDVLAIILCAISGFFCVAIIVFFTNATSLVPLALKLGDNPIFLIYVIGGIMVGAGASFVVGQYIRSKIAKKESIPQPSPIVAGVEYKHHILDIEEDGLPWPIYSQDPWPIHEEPLATGGPVCPKCRIGLIEAERKVPYAQGSAAAAKQYIWKCSKCKFSVFQPYRMEEMFDQILEKAQESLEKRKGSKAK